MRVTAALALATIALVGLSVRSISAETATLDAVEIQDLGKELLAIRDGNSPSRIRLEKREQVLWSEAKGIVGAVLTDSRSSLPGRATVIVASPSGPGVPIESECW